MVSHTHREWVPLHLENAMLEKDVAYAAMSLDGLEAEIHNLLNAHEIYMDHECINLYAGTNIMNPRAAKVMTSSVSSRPSLGYPGDKYEMGMQYAEQLEIITANLLRRIFDCRFVEFRVGSGSLANLYGFMATTNPGDTILAFSRQAAGHVTHHAEGAAGLYKLNVKAVPYNDAAMTVDLDLLAKTVQDTQPKLIVVGGSMCLFPYPVADVREIADSVGARVMYDAAHMSGLIAGGEFQQPLKEGAHFVTSSTYKSFGGPPSGMILTDDAIIAERLDQIAYPGLTANFDLAKTAALAIACMDLLEHGQAYAKMCIENAQALATALNKRGVPVHHAEGKGFTASQHIALPAAQYGGGTTASRLLEKVNILTSGIELPLSPVQGDFNAIRLGTQEITRWGMTPTFMPPLADMIARVLQDNERPEQVKQAVLAFRRHFQSLHFVR